MKKNLIPIFIQHNIKNKSGILNAFVLSGDICNFTPIVEKLMKNEKEGAENIGLLLNKTLGEITNIIYANNGFITSFAGDAFTAIFEKTELNTVFSIMQSIIELFDSIKFMNKKVYIRLGLSFGNISWYIIGDKKKTYIFKGEGLNNAYSVQQNAKPNTICFDKTIKNKIHTKDIIKSKQFYYIKKYNKNKIKKCLRTKENIFKFNNIFYPDILDSLSVLGELRSVIPIFINIPYNINEQLLLDFINKIEELSLKFKGYFNKMDFGDKGGMALIIFGAPYTYENMVDSALSFSQEIYDYFKNKLNITIGLDYGKTYSGFIGSKIWQEYTVIGDIVNTSARLASLKNNEINISQNIINQTNTFSFKLKNEIKLKGKKHTLKVYSINKKIQKEIKFIAPFVGRDNEVKKIINFINKNNKNKKNSYIFITGESGIGKTRIAYEIIKKLNLKHIYTSADPILQEPLYPIKQLISNILHIDIHYDLETQKNKIDTFLRKHFPNEYKTYIPFIYSFFSIESKDKLNLSAQEKLQITYYILRNIIDIHSKNKTLALLFDDTMWVDEDTIDFINYLYNENIKNLIFFFVYREENRITKRLKINNKFYIKLTHFNISGTGKFAEKFFNKKISNNLLKILWEKSEGNPLFLEQISLHLQDNNALEEKKNILYIKKNNNDLPSNIDRLIVSRLDNLSGETRNGIQKASVIGKEFEILLLRYLMNKNDVKPILTEGEKNKIISIITKQTGMFRHTLLYEIAYKMQFENSVKKLHKKIATLYEKLYANNLIPYYETLYYHYGKAEIKSKTIFYLKKSIDKAIKSYSNELALNLLKELIIYKTSKQDIIEAYLKIGEIYNTISEHSNAIKIYRKLLNMSLKKSQKAEAYKGYGKTLWYTGKYKNALKYYNNAFELYKTLKYNEGIAEIFEAIGLVYYNLGNFQKAIDNYKHALQYAKNNIAMKNSINSNLGLVLYRQGEMKKAMKYYKKALQNAVSSNNLNNQAILHLRMGLVLWKDNKYENALNHFFTALNINRKIGNKRGEGIVLGNIGIIYMEMKEEKKGLEYYFKALEIDRQVKNLENETIILGNIANYYASKKQYTKSLKYYKDAIKIDKILGNKWSEAIDLGNMAEVYKLLKKYKESDKYFKKCITIVKEMNARHPISHFLLKRSELQFFMKNYTLSLKLAKEAKTIAEEINITHLINDSTKIIKKLNKKIAKENK